jgi:hypothetical protein
MTTSNDAIAQALKEDEINGLGVPSLREIEEIAEEGFVYGLPIVMNYASIYELFTDRTSSQYKGATGTVNSMARVFTYEDTAVITPNSDTPYSMLNMDLRAEPTVISVPAVPLPRYYSVQLTDGNTFNYGYIGTRSTGSEVGDYMVVGPDWKGGTPASIKGVYYSSTQFSVAIFRTQLFNPEDMPNVVAIQAGYKAQPLSEYLGQSAPPAAPVVNFPRADADIAKHSFFDLLNFALQFAPAGPEETGIRMKLARIGVGPGKQFTTHDLSLVHKAAILLGMKRGSDAVDKYIANAGVLINGWHVGSFFGARTYYNGDWLQRAAAARAGIYGNNAVEAMYPMCRTTPDGKPLDGSKYKYTLTFASGELPPVNAFWSVTMYDGKTQFLIKNPIDRYLINSPMLPGMKLNADGSLTLCIQKDSPGADQEANWLPAPDGPIYLVMRLYWPKEEPPSILPPGKGTWQPPALVVA